MSFGWFLLGSLFGIGGTYVAQKKGLLPQAIELGSSPSPKSLEPPAQGYVRVHPKDVHDLIMKTSQKGTIDASLVDLQRAIGGPPLGKFSDAWREWTLVGPDGNVFMIYYQLYYGRTVPKPNELVRWNIGASTSVAGLKRWLRSRMG